MGKIAIIGEGRGKAAIAAALAKMGHNDVVIMTTEGAKVFAQTNAAEIKNEPLPIKYIAPYHYEEKKFICKGKHQYENKEGQWVCQCGKKIND